MGIPTITPKELQARRQSGKPVDLIDVRTPVEFREIHIVGARSMPLDNLSPQGVMAERKRDATDPLYVVCRTGGRARQACERFLAAGLPNVVSVEGGTLAWEQAGLPVERGRKAVSLERQVRITAGSIVLLGAVLAVTVNTWFALLSAFIGAGLVFSGVTDTCGMGLLLARMPWNRVTDAGKSCSTPEPAIVERNKP